MLKIISSPSLDYTWSPSLSQAVCLGGETFLPPPLAYRLTNIILTLCKWWAKMGFGTILIYTPPWSFGNAPSTRIWYSYPHSFQCILILINEHKFWAHKFHVKWLLYRLNDPILWILGRYISFPLIGNFPLKIFQDLKNTLLNKKKRQSRLADEIK